MAKGPGGGKGRKKPAIKYDSSRCRPVDTGLPVLAPDRAAGGGDTGLWDAFSPYGGASPLPDGVGQSPSEKAWIDQLRAVFGNRGGLRADSDGYGPDGAGSEEGGVQRAGKNFTPQLPDVPNGHLEPPEEAVAEAAVDGIRDRDDIRVEQDHDALKRVTSKSLRTIEEILDIPTPPSTHENYIRVLTIKKDISVSGITAQLKADENAFRKRKSDALTELYEQVGKALGHRPGSMIDATPKAVPLLPRPDQPGC